MSKTVSLLSLLLSTLLISTLCQSTYLYDNSGSLDSTIGYNPSDPSTYDATNAGYNDYYGMNSSDYNNYNSDGYIYDYNNSDYSIADNSTDPGVYYAQNYNSDSLPYDQTTPQPQFSPSNSIQYQQSLTTTPQTATTFTTTPPPTNSVVPAYLKGNYIMKVLGSNLPAVPTTFNEKGVAFTGCNIISLPYTAFSNGNFKTMTSSSSTSKACSANYDNNFVQCLQQANSFQKSPNGFTFSIGGKQTIECQGPIQQVKKANKVSNLKSQPNYSFISNIPQGSFKLSLPGTSLPPITALLGSKGLQFSGCNSIAVLCSSNSLGSFLPGNIVTGSQKQCPTNNDQGYLQAIMAGDSFTQQGNNFYVTKKGSKICDFQYMGVPQTTSFLPPPLLFPGSAAVTAILGGVTIGSKIPIPSLLSALPSINITPQSQSYGVYGSAPAITLRN
jgi:hypothetical protein